MVFGKKREDRAASEKETEQTGIKEPKYSRPKLLLIDVEPAVTDALTNRGYTVSTGTFGQPYQVKKKSEFDPVIPNGKLPNYTEQDIVVIDLTQGKALQEPGGEKLVPMEEDDWWASCKYGVIDPRPRFMSWVRLDFDRILDNGGVFIVFAEPRFQQEMRLGNMVYDRFVPKGALPVDNWSFLEILGYLTASPDSGEEITAENESGPTFLADYVKGSSFSCVLAPDYGLNSRWLSIAHNKYQQCVSGVILPSETRKGLVLIFPHLRDQMNFLIELLEEKLPGLAPSLFPFFEGAKWVERPEYELPAVLDLKNQIQVLTEEADENIRQLNQRIEAERASFAYLHQLISGSGDVLVAAVKKALEVLGFQNVKDMDQELMQTGSQDRKREDLRLEGNPMVLVEVKGITGGIVKDADAIQVLKYIPVRMKELGRTDIRGLSIINQQKHIPPLERQQPFHSDILTVANEHEIGMLTCFDLFRLVRNFQKNGWKHELIRPLFYRNGVIKPIPVHYQYVGVIEKYWEPHRAVGIRIEQGNLALGARIAFEFPIEFGEQVVESLQVEKQAVDCAEIGMLAGVLTDFSKEHLQKGTRVFVVTEY